jgi:hypothetical protein
MQSPIFFYIAITVLFTVFTVKEYNERSINWDGLLNYFFLGLVVWVGYLLIAYFISNVLESFKGVINV